MYRLKPGNSLYQDLQKAARSQVSKAIRETDLPDSQQATHQVRKRGKKTRALLRLIRYTDASTEALYQSENAHFRSINDLLSANRDTVSLYEAVVEELDAERFPHIASYLRDRTLGSEEQAPLEAGRMLRRGRRHIGSWRIEHLQPRDLKKGYRKSYRRATKALRAARYNNDDQSFHTLRKRVKDQWYHSRLLKQYFPKTIGRRCKPLKTLASDLGNWRDLRLLCHFLALNSADLDGAARAELIPLLDQSQQRLNALTANIERRCQQLFASKHWRKQKKRARTDS